MHTRRFALDVIHSGLFVEALSSQQIAMKQNEIISFAHHTSEETNETGPKHELLSIEMR